MHTSAIRHTHAYIWIMQLESFRLQATL